MSATDNSELEYLIARALEVRQRSYSPYSKFRVGAAVETDRGNVYAGCNVENAAFGITLCAEQNAIGQAIAAGDAAVRRVIVVAAPLASPCGACRQFIAEFGNDVEVVAVDAASPEIKRVWKITELLPEGFNL